MTPRILGGWRQGEAEGRRSFGPWWLLAVLALAFVTASVWLQHGGYAHFEAPGYLRHWLGPKSFLAKIFDSQHELWGSFQARELSYVFDYLDAQFVAASIRAGIPHFFSVTIYAFALVIGWLAYRFGSREVRVEPFALLCLVVLYWTDPTLFFGTIVLRTAKIGVALAIALAFPLLYAYDRLRPVHWIELFLLGCTASLFDRQGVYMVGVAAGFLALHARSSRPAARGFVALLASIGFSSFYNNWLGPTLTFSLNGYWPNASYQNFSLTDLLHQLLWLRQKGYNGGSPMLDGLVLVGDTFRFMFGNTSLWVAGLALAAIAVVLSLGVKRTAGPWFVVLLLAFAVMNALMVIKHPPVIWPDVRRIYYWVPAATVFLFLAPLVLRAAITIGCPSWALNVLLLAAVLGNVVGLPEHRHVLEVGHLRFPIAIGPDLLDALRHLSDPAYVPKPVIKADATYQLARDLIIPAGTGQAP